MSSPLVDLFWPRHILSVQLDAFSAYDKRRNWSAILVFYGVPLVVGGAIWWLGGHPLESVAGGLLTAAALVGSVLIAISAVLVQALLAEATRPGFADSDDRRRLGAIRRLHATVAYGSFSSFVLTGILLWLVGSASGTGQGDSSVLANAIAMALVVHLTLALVRVLIATDMLVHSYADIAANRVNT